MPYFEDDDEVYRYLVEQFQDLADDDARVARVRAAETIVQVALRNPVAQITLKLKSGQEVQVDFGPTDLPPEIVLNTEADTLHSLCLGRLNFTVALARGQVKAQGPVAKILKILPLR